VSGDAPDPIAEVHRLLDQQRALTAAYALPPLVFAAATVAALVVELPELALALGTMTALSGVVAALTAWERLRKIRAVRRVIDEARANAGEPDGISGDDGPA
jgi:hypothetical protein